MKEPLSRRMEIVYRLLELEFIEDTTFSGATVINEIMGNMKTQKENNEKDIHDLTIKHMLLKNNISPEEDNNDNEDQ